ncbi:MAG: DUF4399 domain-containing protein [Candidatus Accumulibacter meliphilus]|jgi:uncharacterized protein YgiM (DUF1202 family)|uniref:DUF4399 domain-containing protein n=1 Tax=Candidatus Accumulibacter meliphilus TaxID=2211374 RepID=UPI002FC3AFB1
MIRYSSIAISSFLLGAFSGLAQGEPGDYTALSNSNIRAAPTTNSHRIGYLNKGQRIRVVGSAAGGNWHQVRLDSGQMGFVYSDLLAADASQASPADRTTPTGGPTPAPEGAFSYIVWPTNGEVIPGGDFVVVFGLHGMGVAPASVDKEYTGHHHLLIDTDLPPLAAQIPNDDNHVHFGRGQTEYQLTLPSGTHTLQLLLGDANHFPHTPPVMSEKITIKVP